MSLLGSGLSGPTRLNALRQRVVIWVAALRGSPRRARACSGRARRPVLRIPVRGQSPRVPSEPEW